MSLATPEKIRELRRKLYHKAKVRHNVDAYVYERVRHLHRRRSKHDARGTARFPAQRVFGRLGALSLKKLPRRRIANAL